MAPNVTVAFWAANDINGTPIHTITDEDPNFKKLVLKPDLNGLGGWELTLSRQWGYGIFDDQAARMETFVRFLIHAYSDTDWYWGGVIGKRQQDVVHRDELGAEEFTLGGPGPKQYLERYRLLTAEQSAGAGHVDLAAGVWRWNEDATDGRIVSRLIDDDAAADDPALPDISKSFGPVNDSNGDPWTNTVATDGTYEIEIGRSLLEVVWDFEDLGEFYTTVNLGTVAAPLYELEAWQAYGEDVSGSDFGSGVGLLREGVNIANDALTVTGVGLRKATHVIVEGKDGTWATTQLGSWSPGDYVKWAKIDAPNTSRTAVLERRGLRWLRRQENGDREITVEIVPGDDPDSGYYFPSPTDPIWLGNTIALDTIADGSIHSPMDYSDDPQLVTGLELELGPAGDDSTADKAAKSWDIKVRLNSERGGHAQSPNQSTSPGGKDGKDGGCTCLRLCPSTTEPATASVDQFLNANDPGGNDAAWSGLLGNQGGSGDGANGTDYYYFKSGGGSFKYQASRACTPGQTITVEGWYGCRGNAHLILAFTTLAAGSSSGIDSALVEAVKDLHPDEPDHSHANEWTHFSQSYTVPATTVSYALGTTGTSGGGTDFDEITVSLGEAIEGSHPLHGTDGTAAHCDHIHHVFSETDDPTVDDDEADGYPAGTLWVNLDTGDTFILTDATEGAAVWTAIGGGGGSYTDEQAQDAVGTILVDSSSIDFTYNDATPSVTGVVLPAGVDHNTLANLTTGDPHTQYSTQSEFDDHSTRHEAGGADKIKLDDLEPPDDNTDLNASTSKHGLLKKLPNDATKYLDGAGNFTDPGLAGGSTGNVIATPSGSIVTIPGLALGDRKPASAGTYDEEFNGTADTLPANWAFDTTPSGSDLFSLNSRWPSLLTVEGTAVATYNLSRTSFSAAATFGIWAKLFMGPWRAADDPQMRLYCTDSTDGERRGGELRATGANAATFRGLKRTGAGAENVWGTAIGAGFPTGSWYIGLTRTSNNWIFWVSTDGITWFKVGSSESQTFTVDRFRLLFKTSADGCFLGCDWIRYRTDTSFPRP